MSLSFKRKTDNFDRLELVKQFENRELDLSTCSNSTRGFLYFIACREKHFSRLPELLTFGVNFKKFYAEWTVTRFDLVSFKVFWSVLAASGFPKVELHSLVSYAIRVACYTEDREKLIALENIFRVYDPESFLSEIEWICESFLGSYPRITMLLLDLFELRHEFLCSLYNRTVSLDVKSFLEKKYPKVPVRAKLLTGVEQKT